MFTFLSLCFYSIDTVDEPIIHSGKGIYIHICILYTSVNRDPVNPSVSCKALLCMHLLSAYCHCVPTQKPVTMLAPIQANKFIFVVIIVRFHVMFLLCR